MKKWKVILGLLLACAAFSQAGEIKYNSVPGGITYQGRLERDNAPITGVVHIYFRLYNGLTGGILRWDSGEITTTATGGIFSASFTPPLSVLGNGEQLYLEVQIEGEVLSPREAINSVMYSLISKKLEDGANVAISTLTAGYTVLLATQPYANVGIGENNPNMKLVVGGSIRVLSGGQLCFDDSGCTNNVGSGSAGSLTNLTDANINADSDANATGAVVFNTAGSEKIRMLNNGNLGIGTASPAEKLYVVGNSSVTGNMYMGSAGVFNNGMFPGANSEKIYVGSPDNVISFYSNGGERMRIDANNYIGIGNSAPTQPLEVTGKALASSGFAGAQVGVGAYWGSYSNELRSADAANLVVQYSNPMNVGIGMLNPTEKLDVNGSIRAEKGIISSTAAFADDVTILGNLNVNGYNKVVNLSTTNVYGTFTVFGTLNLGNGGSLVSLGSTQTFSGENTFLGQTVISSQTVVNTRMGVGMIDFDFPGARYLQVGDSNVSFSNQDALLYLVGGSLASAKVDFFRGGSEVGRIETIGSGSLSFDVGGQKAVMDSSNVKVYNSNFIVSPSGSDVTPSIYVNKANYNVGIGTTSATYRLNVDGTLKLVGAGSAIMFNDGTVLTSSGSSTAQGISNAGDAVIWADSDANGVGKVVLKAGGGSNPGLAVNSNGQVGIGTVDPDAKLKVLGGDVMLGNTSNPLSGNGIEDLIVAGSLIVDGGFQQRSASPVNFAALTVSGNVYLSTNPLTSPKVGVGTDTPGFKLDVQNGDINTSGTIRTGGTTRISNTGTVGSGGGNATWDGNTIAVNRGGTGKQTFTSGGLIYGNGTNGLNVTPAMGAGGLVIGGPAGTLSTGTITSANTNRVTVTLGNGTISLSGPQDINTTSSPQFAGLTVTGVGTGMVKATAAGALSALTGTPNKLTRWSDTNTIEASTILTDNGAKLTVSGPATVTGSFDSAGLTASSGTFTASGATQYSVQTTSGILVSNGVINMTSHKVVNLLTPTQDYDASTKKYVDDSVSIGVGSVWNMSGNLVGGSDWLGSSNAQDIYVKRGGTTRLTVNGSGIDVNGDITVSGNVDGVDISAYSPYFIGTAGTSGQVWKSDGTGAGVWGTDNTDDSVSGSELDGVFSTTGLLKRTGLATYAAVTDNSANWDTAYTHSQNVTGNVHGATSANTVNMIVRRGSSGEFSAGLITASFSGTLTGSVTGNADTATTATTATNVSGGTVSSATIRLISKAKATLLTIPPGAVGEMYYCNDCSPAKIVVSTGTSAGNFADAIGGTFQ